MVIMKTQFSALDLAGMVKELQFLIGAKVDNIYHKEKELLLQLHIPNQGKKQLRIIVPNLMYLTEHKGTYPEKPSGFCMFLRKHLLNARLRALQQKEFERIAEFLFETAEGTFLLYAEFFSPGNIVVCNSNNIILLCLEVREFSTRKMKSREPYTYPHMKYNFLHLTEQQLHQCLQESNKESLVKTLAMDLGLGGVYAEELCLSAQVDKNKKKLTETEMHALFTALKKMQHLSLKPSVVNNEIFPLEMQGIADGPKTAFSNFSEALDATLPSTLLQPKTSAHEKEIQRTVFLIEQQQTHLKELEQQVAEQQEKGEYIYHHYQELQALLQEIKEKGIRTIQHKSLKKINEKDKEITVETYWQC